MMAMPSLSKLRVLSLLVTQKCNASCDHCGTYSGPEKSDRLELDLLKSVIQQAAENRFTDVVFSGGEPTLLGDELLDVIGLAKSLSLRTHLVSNAWWAKSKKRAEWRIRQWLDAGLDELEISTGEQHVRFIAFEKVVLAAVASVEVGVAATVIIELLEPRSVSATRFESTPEIKLARQNFPDRQLNVHESPWMSLSSQEILDYPEGIAANSRNLGRIGGCDDVLRTITVSADGSFSACCGVGMRQVRELQLGNIESCTLSEAIRKAESDPFKWRIRCEGPEHILAWAADQDPRIIWENLYSHRCQACIRVFTDPNIRSIVKRHYPDSLSSRISLRVAKTD